MYVPDTWLILTLLELNHSEKLNKLKRIIKTIFFILDMREIHSIIDIKLRFKRLFLHFN